MQKRKLALEDIDVTTFEATSPDGELKGTVHGYITQVGCSGSPSCAASCPNYTCAGATCARIPC